MEQTQEGGGGKYQYISAGIPGYEVVVIYYWLGGCSDM